MLLRFTKMHGLGNDFVLLDLISQDIVVRDEQIRALADRRLGIGFDQLLIVEPPGNPEIDFRYRIFNSDGMEAEQCGNGARCFLRFVRDRGLTTKTKIKLETNTGIIECKLESDGSISVNMGAPKFEPKAIPFHADKAQICHQIDVPMGITGDIEKVELTTVNIGNPHAVIFVADVEKAPVFKLGSAIEKHKCFPEGVNVGFVEVTNAGNIKLRVFERGVGETKACGTGACAAVAAGRLRGLLDDDVTVQLRGGELKVAWKGEEAPVMMNGPACRVYEGRLHI
ncbi:MAG: diaminopimelate epimerase [Pseudomonadales bacterium]|nr:diaminopimelate epimerase [Pseudomonadales bacterium]